MTGELGQFLDHVGRGLVIEGGSEQHRFMHEAAQEAFGVSMTGFDARPD